MTELEQALRLLYKNAAASTDTTGSVSEYEHTFVSVLDFIQKNKDEREAITGILISLMNDKSLWNHEVVGFCMHELRWEEIRLEIARIIDTSSDWRIKSHFSSILEAYDDNWGDSDLYEYFSH